MVLTFNYDINYWDKMIKQNSHTARDINKIRWNFIKPTKARLILDYGSGPGWFRALKPDTEKMTEVDTYDLNPWPQTGINHTKYDLITFWDVIEHFSDMEEVFRTIERVGADYVAITTPVMGPDTVLEVWKHYKPGEHFLYFTEEELIKLFEDHGYKKIRSGYPECAIREDIFSILFKAPKDSVH
jgi:hypothetical protein